MPDLSVPEQVLNQIGSLYLEKKFESERANKADQRFQQIFEVLSSVSFGKVKPEQLWIDLLNKTWDIRQLEVPPLPKCEEDLKDLELPDSSN